MDDVGPILSNNPPRDAVIGLRVDKLIATANTWIAKVSKISDEETAKAARDFVEQLAKQEKVVEAERTAQRVPLLAAAAAVQAVFTPMAAKLDLAKKKLLGILDTWNRAEKKRIADEAAVAAEKARKAEQEAAEAALAAKAPDASIDDIVSSQALAKASEDAKAAAANAAAAKPKLSGNHASRALAERTTWTAVITDWPKAIGYFVDNPDLRIEVQRLADAVARKDKDNFAVPGATVKKDTHL